MMFSIPTSKLKRAPFLSHSIYTSDMKSRFSVSNQKLLRDRISTYITHPCHLSFSFLSLPSWDFVSSWCFLRQLLQDLVQARAFQLDVFGNPGGLKYLKINEHHRIWILSEHPSLGDLNFTIYSGMVISCFWYLLSIWLIPAGVIVILTRYSTPPTFVYCSPRKSGVWARQKIIPWAFLFGLDSHPTGPTANPCKSWND